MTFNSKLPHVTESIFTTMGQMAHRHKAINLSQGFPNFPSDPALTALVTQAMADGYNQYAPMAGDLELRKEISKMVQNLRNYTYNPDTEVTVTAGATQAIFTIIATTIRPGDEVIIFTPAYDCYIPTIELYGGMVVPVQLRPETNYRVNWEEVSEKITSRTKLLIINTPHNPSGMVFSKNDFLKLEELVEAHDLLVLSDEVYEHLVFDNHVHYSACHFPKLVARSFIVASFGKTFHNTGWKMGYCLAPEALMKEFQKVHQFVVFCVHHPTQKGLATYLKDEENYLHLSKMYQQKRDLFINLMQDSPFTMTPSQGTYFQLIDYSQLSDLDDVTFAKRLLKEHGVATIPTSVFNVGNEDFKQLRVCFAKTDETLENATKILKELKF